MGVCRCAYPVTRLQRTYVWMLEDALRGDWESAEKLLPSAEAVIRDIESCLNRELRDLRADHESVSKRLKERDLEMLLHDLEEAISRTVFEACGV